MNDSTLPVDSAATPSLNPAEAWEKADKLLRQSAGITGMIVAATGDDGDVSCAAWAACDLIGQAIHTLVALRASMSTEGGAE